MFISITALSTNWAVVSDMLLSVTLPNKRAFATSIQILLSHLFGDAASPFIIGAIKDYLEPSLGDEYQAFQYALMLTLIILIIGAIVFVHSSRYYVQDVDNCKLTMSELSGRNDNADESIISNAANLTDFAAEYRH